MRRRKLGHRRAARELSGAAHARIFFDDRTRPRVNYRVPALTK